MTLDDLLEAFAELPPEEQRRFLDAATAKPAPGRPPLSFEEHFKKSTALLFGKDEKVRSQEAARKARERATAVVKKSAEYYQTKIEELTERHGGDDNLRRANLNKLAEIFITASGILTDKKGP